jgi:hypothetical protein
VLSCLSTESITTLTKGGTEKKENAILAARALKIYITLSSRIR